MQSMESSDPTSIIGLPLIALTRLLADYGLDPLDHAQINPAVAPQSSDNVRS
jgi:septum formation protein